VSAEPGAGHSGRSKSAVTRRSRINHCPKSFNNIWQINLELLDGSSETDPCRTFIPKKLVKQLFKIRRLLYVAAHHDLFILDQNSFT